MAAKKKGKRKAKKKAAGAKKRPAKKAAKRKAKRKLGIGLPPRQEPQPLDPNDPKAFRW